MKIVFALLGATCSLVIACSGGADVTVVPYTPREAGTAAATSAGRAEPTPRQSPVTETPEAATFIDPIGGAGEPLAQVVEAGTDQSRRELVAHSDTGLRIRIPSLSVDTNIVELGFNEDGQLDVPANGSTVGWYNISARLGSPGNALLGGHLDLAGSTAVFWRLRDLSEGDLVYIDSGSGELAYRVESAYVVAFDAPLGDVLGERSGPETITLFTCGGGFDAKRRGYDERVIVRAAAVTSSTRALD